MLDTMTGDKLATTSNLPSLGDKRAVAVLAGGMSVRWVDGQLSKGMPHLKIGSRRVRFDLIEVAAWLKEQYGQRRLGPAKSNTKPRQ
jgi:predicted DNA-binding transcriptional regulator AlpA